jgi:3-oxoisoapionate decarboxylase
MRLGISSFAYRYAVSGNPPAIDPPGILSRASSLGLDVVQFCDNVPLHLLSSAALSSLVAMANDLGVDLEVGTRGLDDEVLQQYIDVAVATGSRALRLVPDTHDEARIASALEGLLPHLHDAELTLAIENHADVPSERLVAIVERLGDPALGFCLDTANSIALLERPAETVRLLAPRVLQVHMKDYVMEPVPIGYRLTGRVLGEGNLDVAEVIHTCRRAGRDPDYYVEMWMDPANDLETTLAREEEWIARNIAVLREALAAD